jgi:hypothetical protein
MDPRCHYSASAYAYEHNEILPHSLHCSDSHVKPDDLGESFEKLSLNIGDCDSLNESQHSKSDNDQPLPAFDVLLGNGESAIETDGPAVKQKVPSSHKDYAKNLEPRSSSSRNSLEKNFAASNVETDGAASHSTKSASPCASCDQRVKASGMCWDNNVQKNGSSEKSTTYSPSASVNSNNEEQDIEFRVLMLLSSQQNPMKTRDIVKELDINKKLLNSCLYRLKSKNVLELVSEQPQMWQCKK